jgi:hypothetical protein
VCAQWVDHDFQLQKALLALTECRYSHGGAAQAQLIMNTLRSFDIPGGNVGYHTGENATSNDTCLAELARLLEAADEISCRYPIEK